VVDRNDLDEFFAQAEDIVTDWDGSFDASDSSRDEAWWLDIPAWDESPAEGPRAMLSHDFHVALERRRHRNTGPRIMTRLDGRRRRSR
jgi:hypothetical protein